MSGGYDTFGNPHLRSYDRWSDIMTTPTTLKATGEAEDLAGRLCRRLEGITPNLFGHGGRLINPDGPFAAALIRTQAAALATMREKVDTQAAALAHLTAALGEAARTVSWQCGEDDAHATGLRVCAKRRAQWGDDDECDRDGQCPECQSDIAAEHETEGSKARRQFAGKLLAILEPKGTDHAEG
jgi:hypothetical protein